MELMKIKRKINELEETEKLSNNELMRDIAHFCIVYPSEATEEKAFMDNFNNLDNIICKIVEKKNELNDDEKELVTEFVEYFDDDLLHIKGWNIYKNITDREHTGNDYFGETEVEAIKEALPRHYRYLFNYIVDIDNIYFDEFMLNEVIDAVDKVTNDAIDKIIEDRQDVIEDVAEGDNRDIQEVEKEEREREKWIFEEIVDALCSIRQMKAKIDL